MDYHPPGSSVHGLSLARMLEWVALSFSRGSSQSYETWSPALQVDSLLSEPPGKPGKMCRLVESPQEVCLLGIASIVFLWLQDVFLLLKLLLSCWAPQKEKKLVELLSPHSLLGASLVAQRIKCLPAMQETRVRSLGWEGPLEKEMATHSSHAMLSLHSEAVHPEEHCSSPQLFHLS